MFRLPRRWPLFATFLLLSFLAAPAHAAPAPAAPASVAPAPAALPASAAPASVAPADSARRDSALADSLRAAAPAPPPRDYLAEARASYGPESRAYAGARVVVRLVGPLYGILVGLLIMFTGLSVRFRDIAENLGHRRYVRVLVYFALYSLASFLLGLPFAWYEEYALEHQFGLSTQTFGGWMLDSVKGLVLTVVMVGVVPLLALAWRAVESYARTWWLWIAAGTLPVMVVVTLIQPILLDPVFNKFTPLKDAALRGEILELGARAGIPAKNVYQVDMSSRTRKLNAYVNGFGASQRIVLWDTTLKQMKRDEILFVMGHEMGHYVLKHIWKFLGMIAVLAFAVFGLTALVTAGWLRMFGAHWGVRGVGDLAALPVLALSLTLVTLLAMPLLNAASRTSEHEADVFGLEITHDNDAAARAFLQLAQGNRSDPDPPAWITFLLYDHPPLGERIRFALEYKPWATGEPQRFYHGAAK